MPAVILLWICYLWSSLKFTLILSNPCLLVCQFWASQELLWYKPMPFPVPQQSNYCRKGISQSSPTGSASVAKRLGLPWVSHIECPCSQLLSLIPWNWALWGYPGPSLGALNRLMLEVVPVACRRVGSGRWPSFPGLCWLNSQGSWALVPHNKAEGPRTCLYVS